MKGPFRVKHGDAVILSLSGSGFDSVRLQVTALGTGIDSLLLRQDIEVSGAKNLLVEHELAAHQLDGFTQLHVEPTLYGRSAKAYTLSVALRNESESKPPYVASVKGTLAVFRRAKGKAATTADAPLVVIPIESSPRAGGGGFLRGIELGHTGGSSGPSTIVTSPTMVQPAGGLGGLSGIGTSGASGGWGSGGGGGGGGGFSVGHVQPAGGGAKKSEEGKMGKADRISFPSSAKAAAPAPLPATPAESDAEGLNYRVWYGTHRKPILQGKKVIGYSAERDKTTHLGRCIVKVPKSHKFGEEGSTGVWASIKRFVGGEDDRLALTQLDALDSDQFWKGIADQVASAGVEDRDAVVFIHGYKNTFEDAAIRAAQIGADLKIKGAMAFYSWPSRGTAFGYAPDEATIGPSAKFITGFLTKIARKSKAKRVHVIVHSMGNRATLQAVKDIVQTAGKKTGVIFNQFILAAPDVDADEFEDVARHYNAVAARTTLYVSDRDKAVGLSKTAHDYHRVGYAPPFQVVKGIDTVYAGNVDESFMGHSYVASAEWLLNDMHQLIHQDAEPVKRARMRRDDTDQYWILGDKR